MGREYYEGSGFEPETVIEMLVTFLLQKKVPRQTEGEGLGFRALPAARVCRVLGSCQLLHMGHRWAADNPSEGEAPALPGGRALPAAGVCRVVGS